jgi:hypothetical protein
MGEQPVPDRRPNTAGSKLALVACLPRLGKTPASTADILTLAIIQLTDKIVKFFPDLLRTNS